MTKGGKGSGFSGGGSVAIEQRRSSSIASEMASDMESYSTKAIKNSQGITISGKNRQMVEFIRDYTGIDLTDKISAQPRKWGGGVVVRKSDLSINENAALKRLATNYGNNIIGSMLDWTGWDYYIQPNKNYEYPKIRKL